MLTYCDYVLSVVVRRASLTFNIFDFFSRTASRISTKLSRNDPHGKALQLCERKGRSHYGGILSGQKGVKFDPRMDKRCEITRDRFQEILDQKATAIKAYDQWANTYDDDMAVYRGSSSQHVAKAAREHCPTSPKDAVVLDVGCGTGRAGEQLKKQGFSCIDGIDPSSQMIKAARAKGLYRTLYCAFFSKEPLNIPDNSYDMIVTSGAFLPGHLPCGSLYEMIRLVKSGGVISIVTRKESFTLESQYRDDLVSTMKELELVGKWRKLKFEDTPNYSVCHEGVLAVYTVL